MKKIVFCCVLGLGLAVFGSGCIPPPPREHPKPHAPATPPGPSGPAAVEALGPAAVEAPAPGAVMVLHNFANLPG